jgi:hypothetical protein
VVSLIGNRMGILRKIGVGNDICFFFETDLFFFAQVNFNGWLILTATHKNKKADENDTEDFIWHFEISPK